MNREFEDKTSADSQKDAVANIEDNHQHLLGQILVALAEDAKPQKALDRQQAPKAEAPLTNFDEDSFELSTGHKVVESKGSYKITDRDGNSVRIFPNGHELIGKILTNTKDEAGNSVVKFENGNTISINPSGRIRITGSDGKKSTFSIPTLPNSNTPNPLIGPLRRFTQF